MKFSSILFLTIGRVNYDCDVNFHEPLRTLFPHVINYNFRKRANEIGVSAMNREVLAVVDREAPDCVFVHAYRHALLKATLRKLTLSDRPTVMWFSDDQYRFDDYSRYWGEVVSYCVTTDHSAVAKYEALGIPVIQSQWAANADYYRPQHSPEFFDVTFVGHHNSYRGNLIDEFGKQGIRVHAFGLGWPDGYIAFEDMVSVFSSSRINLCPAGYWGGSEVKQIKGRVFEIPMCGGLLMAEYVKGMEQYFDIGQEIICYESVEDAAEKINYYLENEDERKAIASAGRTRALKDHTWSTRLDALFSEVETREQLRTNDEAKRAVSAIAHEVRLEPKEARVVDFHSVEGESVVYASENARVAISLDDLRDSLTYAVDGRASQVVILAELDRVPIETRSRDFIFAHQVFDQLSRERLQAFLSECARFLARDGLLLASSKLWYATDRESIVGHGHRDYATAHSPYAIKTELRKHFKATAFLEVHRRTEPHLAILAAHNSDRIGWRDAQRERE